VHWFFFSSNRPRFVFPSSSFVDAWSPQLFCGSVIPYFIMHFTGLFPTLFLLLYSADEVPSLLQVARWQVPICFLSLFPVFAHRATLHLFGPSSAKIAFRVLWHVVAEHLSSLAVRHGVLVAPNLRPPPNFCLIYGQYLQ